RAERQRRVPDVDPRRDHLAGDIPDALRAASGRLSDASPGPHVTMGGAAIVRGAFSPATLSLQMWRVSPNVASGFSRTRRTPFDSLANELAQGIRLARFARESNGSPSRSSLGLWSEGWWTAGGSNSRPPRCERAKSEHPNNRRHTTSA